MSAASERPANAGRQRIDGDEAGAGRVTRTWAVTLAHVRAAAISLGSRSPRARWALEVLVVAVLYYGAASLGLQLAFEKTNASPVWPPSGFALAAVLLRGYRVWPGITVGALGANVAAFLANEVADSGVVVAVSAAIAVGNTLEAVAGAVMLRRLVGSSSPFDRARDVFKFAAMALVACLVSPSIGPTAIVLAGMAPGAAYGMLWFTWWLGDTTGMLLLTPVLITWARGSPPAWGWRRHLEAALLLASLVVSARIGFGGWFLDKTAHYPLPFVPIPWLVWAAFRFGPREAATAAAATSGIAVWDTIHGFGPFVRETVNTSLLLLQAFAGIVTLTILTMAAVVRERRQAQATLLDAYGDLDRRVQVRTRELQQVNEVLRAEIVERERAEHALRAAETRFRGLLEFAPDAMVIMSPDGTIVLVNAQAETLFGYARGELIGQPMTILVPDGSWSEGLASPDGRPGGAGAELRGVRKDGTAFPVEVTRGPLKSGDESLISSAIRDISERKQAEEALRHAEKLAAMSALLAGVAHELNNPLTVVKGQAELLRRAVTDSEPLATRADKIVRAVDRCARIVRNFLALARRYPPERQPMKLNEVVWEAVELLAYSLAVDDVEVCPQLAEDLPIVWADAHQIHQVTVNLMANAHQAMRGRPLPRQLALRTGRDADARRVWLEVADTGPGVPLDVQLRIFEPFFTTKPAGQGTGLGLALSRAIIEAHGGTIQVESRPGEGATFRVELPATPQTPPAPAPPAEGSPSISGATILVVDDEPEIAAVLAETLAGDGHRVETAANGVEALHRIRERTFDLILSDIKMPGLDGPGLYRELGQRDPRLRQRMIFITGDTLSPETRSFLARSGAPSLSKPGFTDVGSFVRQVLHRLESSESPGPLA